MEQSEPLFGGKGGGGSKVVGVRWWEGGGGEGGGGSEVVRVRW